MSAITTAVARQPAGLAAISKRTVGSISPRVFSIACGVGFLVLCVLASGERWSYLGAQLVAGLGVGSIAALSGTGLVLAYRATGVFNFAQAGVSTVAAFSYYELTSNQGVPVVLGLLVAVAVVGPLLGIGMDVVVFRPLQRRSAGTSEKLVANLGVLILLLGICGIRYGSISFTPKNIFPPTQAFSVGSGHNTVAIPTVAIGNLLLVIAGGGGLAALFAFTRIGRQIRAVVDRRGLAELNAVNANRVSALSWAVGCAFAALAGVLYTPVAGLQNGTLALTVLQTISVAVIAKLKSIGAAVSAGLGLGVVQSLGLTLVSPRYPSWLPLPSVPSVYDVEIPVLATLAFLLIYRNLDEVGSAANSAAGLVTASFSKSRSAVPAPTTVVPKVLLGVVAVIVIPAVLSGTNLGTAQQMVGYAVAFLSIVAITGYSGHISLATASFGGLGAYISTRLHNGYLPLPTGARIVDVPVIPAMFLAGLIVVPLGIAVGFPALRRKGLILGLLTLAFAQVVDALIFQEPSWTAAGRQVDRPHIFGLSLEGDTAFLYFELIVLGFALLLVRNLRSGTLGRMLGAMRDSEPGSVSVGVALRRYKLFVFGASAFIAAIGGSLIAQQQRALDLNPGGTFSPLAGLYWFGAVVVFGLSYRSGALLAAIAFVGIDTLTGQAGSSLVFIGAFALFIGYLPGGLIGSLIRAFRGDQTDGLSPLKRSLAAYADTYEQRQAQRRQVSGRHLQPTAYGSVLRDIDARSIDLRPLDLRDGALPPDTLRHDMSPPAGAASRMVRR